MDAFYDVKTQKTVNQLRNCQMKLKWQEIGRTEDMQNS